MSSPPDIDAQRARFASAMLARETLRRAVALLDTADIRAVPLKGVLLHGLGAVDPVARSVSDVDLLVAPARLDEATEQLRTLGYPRIVDEPGAQGRSRIFTGHDALLTVDLHARLFDPSRYRLDTGDVLARATRDETRFCFPVWLPDPRDAFAHLVGHLAHDWIRTGRLHHPGDLAALAAAADLSPDVLADHLAATGLVHAAHIVLPLVDDPLARTLLERLPRTSRDRLLVPTLPLVARTPALSTPRRAVAILSSDSLRAALFGALRRRLLRRPDLD